MSTIFVCKHCENIQYYELPHCLMCSKMGRVSNDFFVIDVTPEEWGKLSPKQIRERIGN